MRTSNCSSGVAVDLYWRYCTAESQDEHIDAMVAALFGVLCGEHRRWSPPAAAHTKARFRWLINKAARGEVVPVDEVKPIRGGLESLFELRWNNIDVLEVKGEQRTYLRTGVRLIHAEPMEISVGMVGLLAHEKPYIEEGKEIQRDFIAKAEVIYNKGVGNLWGITQRNV